MADSNVRELRRAYYSAVSWVDSLSGVVLNELERLGLSNNTVVSLLGITGTNSERTASGRSKRISPLQTHAPIMILIPGLTDNGIVTERVLEFVDLFPTLVDAVGLPPIPVCPDDSLTNSRVRKYPRNNHGVDIMGYFLRSEPYRYTEWVDFSYQTYNKVWTRNHGKELYDHQTDPDENFNAASDHAFANLVRSLASRLHAGWRHVSPSINNPTPPIIG